MKPPLNDTQYFGKSGKAWEAERRHIQDELNHFHDRWTDAISKGDMEASERIWQEIDCVYQKMKDHLPITPTG